MDQRQLELVRASLSGRSEGALALAADLFHARLFLLAPELEDLFDPDAGARNAAFERFLRALAADLDRPDRLPPRLVSLARAAARAGVTPAEYDTVRTALLFALRLALHETFSVPTHAAWRSAFDWLADGMKLAVVEQARGARIATMGGPPKPPAARSGTHLIAARTSSIPPPVTMEDTPKPPVTMAGRAAG